MNVKTPIISKRQIWLIVLLIAIGCLFWASVTWLHEQGIRMDLEAGPVPPQVPPQNLQAAAAALPKIEGQIGAREGD